MLVFYLLLAWLQPSAPAQPQPTVKPSVVSTAWLAAHLDDPSVAVIDTSRAEAYAKSHIKGARLVTHEMTMSMGNHGLLPATELAAVLARAGGGDGKHVVLYGDQPMATGWIYMAFTALGRGADVSILDGNLSAWAKEGRPVDAKVPPAATGTITVRSSDAIVDANYVKDRLEKPAMCLIDARTTREVGEGRLPGSTLVLWQDLYADQSSGRFKSADDIRAMFVKAGYKPGAEVVTYCAIGMRASLMFFAARYAGLPAKVYVGSWADWSQRAGFPIIK